MRREAKKLQNMVMTAAITAIIIVMSSVPFLGYIPLGFMNATIIHVPVIIGAVLLGPKSGAFLGLVFGITSVVKATFQPGVTSFVFSPFYSVGDYHGNGFSLVIALVPRVLIGVVAYYVFQGAMKLAKGKKGGETAALALAGIAGSLTNTLLVMHFIYLFFGESYAIASAGVSVLAGQTVYGFILGIIFSFGIPEAVVAAILTAAVGRVMKKAFPGGM